MKRVLSISMALLLSLSLAVPLFASDATNRLPACCRRAGLHHCAAAGIADPGARTVSTIAPKCPNWPKSTPASWPDSAAPADLEAAGIPLYANPASPPQIEARYRIAFARSRQKRGPPAASVAQLS